MPTHSRKTTPLNVSLGRSTPQLQALPTTYFFAPDLEREINLLDSVTSAKVLSIGSEIDEIHVVAPRDRPPKKIVRDIESLLLVRFGIRIDHRCISIVQMDHLPATYPQNVRPQIQSVSHKDGRMSVSLAIGERVLLGHSEMRDDSQEPTIVARAVVHAIEQLLQTPGVLSVLKTQVVEMNEYNTVLVLVRWVFADQHELLLGASILHDDLLETAARATLDAVNRRLVRIHTGQT